MDFLEIIKLVAGGVVTALLLGGISWLLARVRPRERGFTNGRIAPNRSFIAITALFSIALGSLAAYAALAWNGGMAAASAGVAFLALGAATATGLTRAYDVEWDGTSITGPTSYGIWPFGPSRATVRFSDIEDFGEDRFGSWYVEDGEAQRIRWNYTYGGYPALMWVIIEACPHIFPEEDWT